MNPDLYLNLYSAFDLKYSVKLYEETYTLVYEETRHMEQGLSDYENCVSSTSLSFHENKKNCGENQSGNDSRI